MYKYVLNLCCWKLTFPTKVVSDQRQGHNPELVMVTGREVQHSCLGVNL